MILYDGLLIGWTGRSGQSLVTFLAPDEPDVAQRQEALAKALVGMAERRGRSAMLTQIDGVPAPESAFAAVLARHGFASRRGVLIRLVQRARPALEAHA